MTVLQGEVPRLLTVPAPAEGNRRQVTLASAEGPDERRGSVHRSAPHPRHVGGRQQLAHVSVAPRNTPRAEAVLSGRAGARDSEGGVVRPGDLEQWDMMGNLPAVSAKQSAHQRTDAGMGPLPWPGFAQHLPDRP